MTVTVGSLGGDRPQLLLLAATTTRKAFVFVGRKAKSTSTTALAMKTSQAS